MSKHRFNIILRHVWERKHGYHHHLESKKLFATRHLGLFFRVDKSFSKKNKRNVTKLYTFGIALIWVKVWVSFK